MSKNLLSVFQVNQGTSAELTNIYNNTALLILVTNGHKKIMHEDNTCQVIKAGEVLVISPQKFISVINVPEKSQNYSAICLSYTNIGQWLQHCKKTTHKVKSCYQSVDSIPQHLEELFYAMSDYQSSATVPDEIKQYKLIEPLVWLDSLGVSFNFKVENSIYNEVRNLILSNLSYRWRISDVARHFCYSEATLRRKLQDFNTSFSNLLINVRLEKDCFYYKHQHNQ